MLLAGAVLVATIVHDRTQRLTAVSVRRLLAAHARRRRSLDRLPHAARTGIHRGLSGADASDPVGPRRHRRRRLQRVACAGLEFLRHRRCQPQAQRKPRSLHRLRTGAARCRPRDDRRRPRRDRRGGGARPARSPSAPASVSPGAFLSQAVMEDARDGERDRASASLPTLQSAGYAVGAALAGLVANAAGYTVTDTDAVRSAAVTVFAVSAAIGLLRRGRGAWCCGGSLWMRQSEGGGVEAPSSLQERSEAIQRARSAQNENARHLQQPPRFIWRACRRAAGSASSASLLANDGEGYPPLMRQPPAHLDRAAFQRLHDGSRPAARPRPRPEAPPRRRSPTPCQKSAGAAPRRCCRRVSAYRLRPGPGKRAGSVRHLDRTGGSSGPSRTRPRIRTLGGARACRCCRRSGSSPTFRSRKARKAAQATAASAAAARAPSTTVFSISSIKHELRARSVCSGHGDDLDAHGTAGSSIGQRTDVAHGDAFGDGGAAALTATGSPPGICAARLRSLDLDADDLDVSLEPVLLRSPFPATSPPPPTGTTIAVEIGLVLVASRGGTVPCPAITFGSSIRMHEDQLFRLPPLPLRTPQPRPA